MPSLTLEWMDLYHDRYLNLRVRDKEKEWKVWQSSWNYMKAEHHFWEILKKQFGFLAFSGFREKTPDSTRTGSNSLL